MITTPSPGPGAGHAGEDGFVFPASCAQRRLWLVHQLEGAAAAYNVPLLLRLRGRVDVPALEAALTAVIARHEALRTVFALDAGELVQIVQAPMPVRLARRSAPPEEPELAEVLRDEIHRPFDLRSGPVFRATLFALAPGECLLALVIDHIAIDAWSLDLLLTDLGAAYSAAHQGRTSPLEPLPLQYADYAAWQEERLREGGLASQFEYWTARLREPRALYALPTERPSPPVSTFRGGIVRTAADAEIARRLHQLSRESGATLFMTLLAAYQVLLARHSGQEDVWVGTPISGRSQTEIERVIGCFLNLLVLRGDLSGAPSFREVVKRVRSATLHAFDNAEAPYEKLVETLETGRDWGSRDLFQAAFVLMPPAAPPPTLPELTVELVEAPPPRFARFELLLTVTERAGGLTLDFEYSDDVFDRSTVERIAERFRVLLGAITADPDASIASLQVLPEAERRLVLGEWCRNVRPFPREATVGTLFSETAARAGERPALVWDGGSLSYAELETRANRLAHHLRRHGATVETRLAVALPRSPNLVVALLACLKTGAAYVPLEPHHPPERLRRLLEDSGAGVLLTDAATASDLPAAGGITRLLLDSLDDVLEREPASPPEGAATPTSAAYVMYTSGSTGQPKGVVVPHRAILRLVMGTDFAELGPGETLLLMAPTAFDAVTFELWGALLHGARLVLTPPGPLELAGLAGLIARHRVTTIFLTTALFNQMVESRLEGLRPLRRILTGGEAHSLWHIRRAVQGLPETRVVHVYGPTENTTFSTWHPVSPSDLAARVVPIGRPVANTTVYVLDGAGQPVPIGVAGELYVGGDGVALGYLHRPTLTAERFVPDPFAGGNARLYRTGDQVRWRPDGTLEFLGRLDQQVKVRGFRIEPSEIEATLLAHSGVREAVVVVRADAIGERRLVAYVVGRAGTGAPDPATLKAHCAERLPDYMVPATVVGLAALPMTSSGKVDRAALPDPGSAEGPAPSHGSPHTTLEAAMVKLWEKLLPGRTIGTRDDFFALGGHSLLAARMVDELERATGLSLPLATLFQGATIEELARYLLGHATPRRQPPMVEVQRGAPGVTPFFMVHGDLTGGGFYCRSLAEAAGPVQPFYAIPPFTPETAPEALTIEAMAARHLEAVRGAQAHGPYRLGGYCIGGVIAYEMARQLRDSGERIELLLIVDASAVNARLRWAAPLVRLVTALTERDPIARLDRSAYLMRYLSMMRHIPPVRRLASLLAFPFGVIGRRLVRLTGAAPLRRRRNGKSSPPARVTPYHRLRGHHVRALYNYVPGSYDGTVRLVVTADQRDDVSVLGWENAAATVEVSTVPSNHVQVVHRDLPGVLQTALTSLDEAAR